MKLLSKQSAALATAFTVFFAANLTHAANEKNIVQTATDAGSFKLLTTALGEADLVEALEGKGPFTVFAPTDAAFKKLPAGTLEMLLKPENKKKLAGILTYHVVPGSVMAADVMKLKGAKSLNGQRIDIETGDGQVKVDGAVVKTADIKCSNGVIHMIDQVILPADKNIVETAAATEKFKLLLAAATKAGLADTLANKGPFTVFAPTDTAFKNLPEGTLESLLKPANKKKLAQILKYHVVSGRVYSEDALAAGKAKTLLGPKIKISSSGKAAKVNKAQLVATDIDAANGVIHVIDSVLLPPDDSKVTAADTCQKIREAVTRGSSMYNCGYYHDSARLYKKTIQELLHDENSVSPELRVKMQNALSHSANQHCASQQSWTLRKALDHAYVQMTAL